ncbi:30S ribosomal protein S4 [bacterium]|nr:30S ribosomal protein S4 [bacterium]NUN45280.1 30S ribosomal protein S4 [bacterium]HMV25548.1 30S ribosomal protein S4 [bacterium]HMW32405.1 30S ribosomal protein S4 [bacterium]HMY35571.1 30S ribosomal protein S4 [bacterium]
MARYTDAVCKLCRREGEKLFLKGTKCLTDKCPIERRNYPPGEHGDKRSKPSGYSIQLREKQKLRRIYGVLERQFRRYFEKAERAKGVTGTALLQILETRLDNMVYRFGFASSRSQARQLVLHRHVEVNGKLVTAPSYQVKPGDDVSIREGSKKMALIHGSLKRQKETSLNWIDVDKASLKGKFLNMPEREQIPVDVKEQLIVELYSK